MSEIGFIQLPRSLLFHPSVIKAPAEQFKVLVILISQFRFSPDLFDDHGLIFEVKPGEYCTTYDELAKLANVDRNHAVRAIQRFSKVIKVTYDKEIFESQILTYEVKRKKTLIKLLDKDTYNLILNQSETLSDTKVKRSRNESEMQKNNGNNVDNDLEEKYKKENFPSSSNESNPSSETNDAGYSSIEGESSIPAESTSHETSDNARYALSVNDLQKNSIKNSLKKVKRRHNVETTNEEHEDLIKFVEEKKSYTEKGKGLEFIELCYDELSEWKEGPARTKVQLKQCAAKCIKKWVAKAVKKSSLEDEEIKNRENRIKLYTSNSPVQNKIQDNTVELIESRKSQANKYIKEHWYEFIPQKRPDTRPDFVQSGEDKLYYKDKSWDVIFPNLMRKAMP